MLSLSRQRHHANEEHALPDTKPKPEVKTGYTVTTAEPHSYGFTADFADLYEALDAAWSLYKMTEQMAVVIDNDPEGDGSAKPTRIYRVGAEYVGE